MGWASIRSAPGAKQLLHQPGERVRALRRCGRRLRGVTDIVGRSSVNSVGTVMVFQTGGNGWRPNRCSLSPGGKLVAFGLPTGCGTSRQRAFVQLALRDYPGPGAGRPYLPGPTGPPTMTFPTRPAVGTPIRSEDRSMDSLVITR